MIGLLKSKRALRVLTVFTILTFLPTAAQAWNFLPEEKEQEEAAVASEPTSSQTAATNRPSVALLTHENMEDTRSRGPIPASRDARKPLPRFDLEALVARSPSPGDGTPTAESPSDRASARSEDTSGEAAEAPRVALSDAVTVLRDEELAPARGGDSELTTRLGAADALRDAGQYAAAYAAYIHLLDDYPLRELEEVETAKDHMEAMVADATDGELADIEAGMPAWESLSTAFGKMHLRTIYGACAGRCKAQGDAQGHTDYLWAPGTPRGRSCSTTRTTSPAAKWSATT